MLILEYKPGKLVITCTVAFYEILQRVITIIKKILEIKLK